MHRKVELTKLGSYPDRGRLARDDCQRKVPINPERIIYHWLIT